MIERLLMKNHLSFAECDIEFSKGLVVFSGPSGAGKSVLMQGLLSLFGFGEVHADVIEATLQSPLGLEEFGFEEENPNIFKFLKAKNARYFINTQSVSKKGMMELSKTFLNYLSIKDNGEFENARLLALLDALIGKEEPTHLERTQHLVETYTAYKSLKDELTRIEDEEKRLKISKNLHVMRLQRLMKLPLK